ncbi:MAG: hypothetical protein ACRC2V_04295 [Xenococcaceae cyanobacterium]
MDYKPSLEVVEVAIALLQMVIMDNESIVKNKFNNSALLKARTESDGINRRLPLNRP